MVLKYKGFNNNWVYEEAEVITSAVVWIGKKTRAYRKGGVRYEKKYSELYKDGKTPEQSDLNKVDLDYVAEMHKAFEKYNGKAVYFKSKTMPGNSILSNCSITDLIYDDIHLSCMILHQSGFITKKLAYRINYNFDNFI